MITHVHYVSLFLCLSFKASSWLVTRTSRVVPINHRFSYFATNVPCETNCDPSTCSSSSSTLNSFVIYLNESKVSEAELDNHNLVRIVNMECTDEQCNYLAWKCLGYQYNNENNTFVISDKVFPKFALKYPLPPDLIGVTRNYADPNVDKPVRDASMFLMRSIEKSYKGGVKNLENYGFKGYKLNELTPNKTRRAQLVNWIMFYRDVLHGKSIEQLQKEAAMKKRSSIENVNLEPKLPSEVMYERNRLDEPPS